MPREAGEALAHHLGRALQLTNILRDIDEDAAIGRLYLPREALAGAGIATDDPLAAAADPKLAAACLEVAARARGHFEQPSPHGGGAAGSGRSAAPDGGCLPLHAGPDARATASRRPGDAPKRAGCMLLGAFLRYGLL